MIRSPLEAVRERKWETASVSFAVVVVLAIPISIALASLCTRSAVEDWLREYTPIVYLQPETSPEAAEELAAEVGSWPLVASSTIRQPKQAHGDLVRRLGEESVQELGVTPGMLPTSIVIEPSVPVLGHIELVSRVAGLQARMEVHSVELPSSEAMRAVELTATALIAAALLAIFGVFAAGVLILSYLERLRRGEDESDRVFALFGAYRSELRRPTIVRGLAIGGWCGAIVAFVGCFGLLAWQMYAPHLMGVDISLPTGAWSVAVTPLLIVPIVGFFAAVRASRQPVRIWRRSHA
jgi:cell division protein FtsX